MIPRAELFEMPLTPAELHQCSRFVFLREGHNVELVMLANGPSGRQGPGT